MELPEASKKTPAGLFEDTSAQEEDTSQESAPESTGGGSSGGGGGTTVNVAGSAAQHEFNAEDRTNAHRLVAISMIIVFVTVAVSQDWWKHLRDFVSTKTHGPATKAKPGG